MWTAPSDDGGNTVIEYDLRYKKSADIAWTEVDPAWEFPGGSLEYAIEGLTGGVSYEVQVRAVTGATPNGNSGESSWSDSATATPIADYDSDNDGLIEVNTLAQLNAIRWDLDGNGSVASGDQSNYSAAFPNAVSGMGCDFDHDEDTNTPNRCVGYELIADLDFDQNGDGIRNDTYNTGSGWQPIGGTFNAAFDGGGHTVTDLFISRGSTDKVGLFAEIGLSGSVTSIGLESANVTGQDETGTLAGKNVGGVTASYATGTVTGRRIVGGLVGENLAAITASYTDVAVSADGINPRWFGGLAGRDGGGIRASYAAGSISGGSSSTDVGGLVGHILGSGSITASFSTGGVSGGSSVGGLVGSWADPHLSSPENYWNTETSGHSGPSGAGAGKTTAELRNPTGYTGIYANWNLDIVGNSVPDDPWNFGSDYNYPALSVDFNSDGTASWQEFGLQREPGPVSSLAATRSGQDLQITWTGPNDTGSAASVASHYRVSSDGGSNWTGWASTITTGYTIATAAGDSYAFQARADNGAAHSPGDIASIGPPSAPGSLQLTRGETWIDASWTTPTENGGSATTGYSVQYRQGTSGDWTDVGHTGTGTTATIAGLTVGLSHQVRVASINVMGMGAYTAPELATTTTTNRSPEFSGTTTNFSVEENTTAVGIITATDPDGHDSVTGYTLSGADADLLSITGDGVLAFDNAPDFESPRCGSGIDSNTCGVTVIASSGIGDRLMTSTRDLTITVTDVNEPPVAPALSAQAAMEGTEFSYQLPEFTDPEDGTLTYEATLADDTTLPAWLNFNPDTRILSGTPRESDAPASLSIKVTATDNDTTPVSSSATFVLTVAAVSGPSLATRDVLTVTEGGTVNVPVSSLLTRDADPEGHSLNITSIGDASNGTVSLSQDGSAIVYVHDGSETTSDSFTYTVSDGSATSVRTVAIRVTPINDPPLADAGPAQRVNEGARVTLDGSGSTDPEGDALTYAWTETSGADLSLSGSNTASPTFTAPDQLDGDVTLLFSLKVTDTSDASSSDTVQVTVIDTTPTVPTISIKAADTSVTEGEIVKFIIMANHAPGVQIDVAVGITSDRVSGITDGIRTVTIPANLISATLALPVDEDGLHGSTGRITAVIQIGAGYNRGTPASATVTVRGNGTDPPPTDDGTSSDRPPSFVWRPVRDQSYTVGESVGTVRLPRAVSSKGNPVYSLSPSLPDGLSFNAMARTITGTPAETLSRMLFTYTATDFDGNSASLGFYVTVVAAPALPLSPIVDVVEGNGEVTLTARKAGQATVRATVGGTAINTVVNVDDNSVGTRLTFQEDQVLGDLARIYFSIATDNDMRQSPPPQGFRLSGGGSAVDITLRDSQGNEITRLTNPARVCLPMSDALLSEAGSQELTLLYADQGEGWRMLPNSSTVTEADGSRLLCADTTRFSTFATGYVVVPMPTPTPVATPTPTRQPEPGAVPTPTIIPKPPATQVPTTTPMPSPTASEPTPPTMPIPTPLSESRTAPAAVLTAPQPTPISDLTPLPTPLPEATLAPTATRTASQPTPTAAPAPGPTPLPETTVTTPVLPKDGNEPLDPALTLAILVATTAAIVGVVLRICFSRAGPRGV